VAQHLPGIHPKINYFLLTPVITGMLMSKDLAKHFLVVVSLLLIPACATVGPRITREEKQRAQALLRAEAQAWQNRQELRIHAVVARLIEAAENVKPLEFHFVAKQENTRRKD